MSTNSSTLLRLSFDSRKLRLENAVHLVVALTPIPRLPYQNSHNEEIVSHLYHAGFQTGVRGILFVNLTRVEPLSSQNYADTILVRPKVDFRYRWRLTSASARAPKCISPSCYYTISFPISCPSHVHIPPNEWATHHLCSSRSGTRSNSRGKLSYYSELLPRVIHHLSVKQGFAIGNIFIFRTYSL